MDSLPLELLGEIATFVHHTELLSLRLVQRRFKDVVTRQAFQEIVVHDRYPSVRRFHTMLDECNDDEILEGVESVVFDGKDPDHFDMGADSTLPSIESAFSRLSRFPNLSSLNLDFFPGSTPDEYEIYMSYYVTIQVSFWRELAQQSFPNLRRLNIGAMVSFLDETITPDHPFLELFRPLTTLSINIVSLFQMRRIPAQVLQFNQNLMNILSPTNNITSLELGTLDFLGPTAPYRFEAYRFPLLSHLKLSKIVFAAMEADELGPSVERGQRLTAEQFIINHRLSLRRLELENCLVALPDGQWCHVLRRLRKSLKLLLEFTWNITVASGTDSEEKEPKKFLYGVPMGRTRIYVLSPADDDRAEDLAALEQLQVAVATNPVSNQ
ncbi:40S ribosomal protein [Mycena indigotica]|uniref:40S ribosomal protein n=1 Tax=Mycena indigotica TaxID=2126181 RepID=A0A8H6W786_9AGAR|nr:40S ribosomal protein [Mycena indigotica]KAF7307427.1 40S ribosomal protein [Mycena indigotica]